ncbi:MAG: hypothetical protein RIT25_672 [Planctomycetota bacterium]
MAADARRTQLSFLRFEFKYVLDQQLREQVEAELAHFVELDPWVSKQQHNQYPVRSLYFDDAHWTTFRDKIDGLHTRSKFRLRTYGSGTADAGAPLFLELKGRVNNLVFKHRTPVDASLDRSLRGSALAHRVAELAAPGDVRDQFLFQLHRRDLRPVVLVDYLRRPYTSRFDPEFRVTFDAQLAAWAHDGIVPPAGANRRLLVPGHTVMEVKFRHHVPAWFHRIVQAYELRRVSISKVCTAVQTLGLAAETH